MNISKRIKLSTLYRSLNLLSLQDRKKLLIVVILQFITAILDLIGVALVGALGALAVSGFGAGLTGEKLSTILRILGISEYSFQVQSAIIAITVGFTLTLRTLATVMITRKTLYYLARKAAVVSTDLISRFLSQPLLKVRETSSQATHFSVTYGATIVILGIVGTAVTAISDIFVLTVLAVGLFLLDPILAFSTLTIFVIVALATYKLSSSRARNLGIESSALLIKSDEKISEVLNSYREVFVRNRREFYAREIGEIRLRVAETSAELQFMPNVSKYVIELTLVIGALVIGALQFTLLDAGQAVASLGVFLAAGTRIAPAIMRIQQGATVIKSNIGVANPTLELIDSLRYVKRDEIVEDAINLDYQNFQPSVSIRHLSFKYPNSSKENLSEVNLEILPGQKVAIVGASGAGKTTLVDMLLGILEPDSGLVQISGESPLAAIKKWSGAIAYVPQDVLLFKGSIRENICLGYPKEIISDEEIWNALEKAQIASFVRSLSDGLGAQVGEKGSKLSGGQRQRFGIARALVTRPKLLVLDEATSSLDGATEAILSKTFSNLDAKMTMVVVAHRLSTIRAVDVVHFLNEGRVIASGTFEEVRNQVPDFDEQARLMGL